MAAKKPAQKTHTWEITLIRESGKFFSYVKVPDLETAIKWRSEISRSETPSNRSAR